MMNGMFTLRIFAEKLFTFYSIVYHELLIFLNRKFIFKVFDKLDKLHFQFSEVEKYQIEMFKRRFRIHFFREF